jgi:hypothetical protein
VHTCNAEEKGVRVLLKCNGTNKWRETVLDNKWFNVKEEIAYKITTGSNKTIELKILVNFYIK